MASKSPAAADHPDPLWLRVAITGALILSLGAVLSPELVDLIGIQAPPGATTWLSGFGFGILIFGILHFKSSVNSTKKDMREFLEKMVMTAAFFGALQALEDRDALADSAPTINGEIDQLRQHVATNTDTHLHDIPTLQGVFERNMPIDRADELRKDLDLDSDHDTQ